MTSTPDPPTLPPQLQQLSPTSGKSADMPPPPAIDESESDFYGLPSSPMSLFHTGPAWKLLPQRCDCIATDMSSLLWGALGPGPSRQLLGRSCMEYRCRVRREPIEVACSLVNGQRGGHVCEFVAGVGPSYCCCGSRGGGWVWVSQSSKNSSSLRSIGTREEQKNENASENMEKTKG